MMDLQTIIDSVVKLPPTPQILPRLQSLLRNPDSGIHDIISLLKVDAPMTAQIVRLSNSAYFGASDPSQSLEEAVGRLGFREVYKVVSMAATSQVFGGDIPAYRLKKGELLSHSIACAVAMVEVDSHGMQEGLDTVYTIGLLHSLGKVVINQYYLKHGLEIYTADAETEFTPALERKLLGFDHADAGAAILRKWNFPKEIYEPIQFQYNPLEAPSVSVGACMLYVARFAALVLDSGQSRSIPPFEGDSAILAKIGMSEDDLREAIQNAAEGLSEIQSMVGLLH
jgi:HD-like signal output (HDOD) protein